VYHALSLRQRRRRVGALAGGRNGSGGELGDCRPVTAVMGVTLLWEGHAACGLSGSCLCPHLELRTVIHGTSNTHNSRNTAEVL
jgi:hypothetical protein